MNFDEIILKWYDLHARDFPWRTKIISTTHHIYKTWVCEVMSQQTLISVVVPKFEQFIIQCPNIFALANCSEETLRQLWHGLGYYARARNLKLGAIYMIEKYKNDLYIPFPKHYKEWLNVPGCGPYTAAMICSICFSEPVASIDGNVTRIVSRLLGLNTGVWNTQDQKRITQYVQDKISKHRPGDFNQALIDLGSTVCKKQNAECTTCPLQNQCVAFYKKNIDQCPPKKIRAEKKFITVYILLLRQNFLEHENKEHNTENESILLLTRTKGLLAKTVGFPLFVIQDKKDLHQFMSVVKRNNFSFILAENSFKHSITKYNIEARTFIIDMKKVPQKKIEDFMNELNLNGNFFWASKKSLNEKISASLDQKALKTLL